MLPQYPGLGPHMTRTPTPPWAVGMEEAGLENAAAGEEIPEKSAPTGEAPLAPRKAKRIRVQLDRRIELTDEELKVLQCFCHAHSVSVFTLDERQHGRNMLRTRKPSAARLRRRGSRKKALALSLRCSIAYHRFVSRNTLIPVYLH